MNARSAQSNVSSADRQRGRSDVRDQACPTHAFRDERPIADSAVTTAVAPRHVRSPRQSSVSQAESDPRGRSGPSRMLPPDQRSTVVSEQSARHVRRSRQHRCADGAESCLGSRPNTACDDQRRPPLAEHLDQALLLLDERVDAGGLAVEVVGDGALLRPAEAIRRSSASRPRLRCGSRCTPLRTLDEPVARCAIEVREEPRVDVTDRSKRVIERRERHGRRSASTIAGDGRVLPLATIRIDDDVTGSRSSLLSRRSSRLRLKSSLSTAVRSVNARRACTARA